MATPGDEAGSSKSQWEVIIKVGFGCCCRGSLSAVPALAVSISSLIPP